jgi:long-chain acyl-CoA synthetase
MGCAQSDNHDKLYSIPIENYTEPKGETPIYRNPSWTEALLTGFRFRWEDVRNLQQLYLRAFEEFADDNMTGTRINNLDGTSGGYSYKTYGQTLEICRKVGSAIFNLDLAPIYKEGGIDYRFVALYAKNREEWIQTDIACALYGITSLPMYDTLGEEAIKFVFDQTDVVTVFCAGDKVEKLLSGVEGKRYHSLQNIIAFDEPKEESRIKAKELGVRLLHFPELLAQGEKFVDYPEVHDMTMYTFCYTSGTTDLPKAAMISHGNVVAEVAATEEVEGFSLNEFGRGDRSFSFLPLAHVLERMFVNVAFARGFCVGFFTGDINRLKDEIAEFQPTLLTAVPRVLNRFHDAIKDQIEKIPQGMKRKLVDDAIKTKMQNLKTDGRLTHGMYDLLVFNKMKAAIGGKVKAIFTGGAPISPDVHDFLRIAFCCAINQGYGLTETISAIFLQRPHDPNSGHVGGPFGSCELKLVDVPDMNYRSTDKGPNDEPVPRGEICIRGPNVFKGYFKAPKLTSEAIDKDGWFHTGDVGQIQPDGALKIIDRKKHIFKLAQGEYVAPEKIENIYLRSKYITEIFVHGDSFQIYLLGIAVPNKDNLLKLANELGISGQYEEICTKKEVIDAVLKDLNNIGEGAKLYGFEQVKKLHLEPVSFITADLCTPSMKLKRAVAKEYYKPIIQQFYSN